MTMLKSWLFRGQAGAFEPILRLRAWDANAARKSHPVVRWFNRTDFSMTQREDENFLLAFNLSLINHSGEGERRSNSKMHKISALGKRWAWFWRARGGEELGRRRGAGETWGEVGLNHEDGLGWDRLRGRAEPSAAVVAPPGWQVGRCACG